MKLHSKIFIVALVCTSSIVNAGVIVGGTRLIHIGDRDESSLSISNPDPHPYLIQSWSSTMNGVGKSPFIITPPLFRLDGGQENILRVVYKGGLPSDRESAFWLNIKSIPSTNKDEAKNQLQIAVKTSIKLIYRPRSLKGTPEELTTELKWRRVGNQLEVINPTSFYMNFRDVTVNGRPVKEVTFVPPMSSMTLDLPSQTANSVSWRLINDYGGTGKTHTVSI